MTIKIKRCDERPVKCDFSQTLYFDNICKRMIAEDNPITGNFVPKFTPEFKCPVQPVLLFQYYCVIDKPNSSLIICFYSIIHHCFQIW